MKLRGVLLAAALTAILTALLAGCSDSSSAVREDIPSDTIGSIADATTTLSPDGSALPGIIAAPGDFVPWLDEQESLLMSNVMNLSWFTCDDEGNLFGRAYCDDMPSLVKNPDRAEEYQVLVSGCAPYNLIYRNGGLFYIDVLKNDETHKDALCFLTAEGLTMTLVYDIDRFCLDDEGDVIYTSSADGFVYRYAAATGETTCLVRKQTRYAYAVGDWLIYQDVADGNTLHAMQPGGMNDVRLASDEGFCPIIEGSTLWFVSGTSGCVCSLDLATHERVNYGGLRTTQGFYLTSSHIYYYDENEEEGYDDDLLVSMPRSIMSIYGAASEDANGVYSVGKEDNRAAFRFALPGRYVYVDYTSGWEYVEAYRLVDDNAGGEPIEFLDMIE